METRCLIPPRFEGKNRSDSVTGTLTHVFSPSMTNETVMAYTFVGFPNVFANPSAVDRTTVGYNYTGLFNNGVQQIPSFGNFGPSEAALVFNPGGFEDGGASGLYANKYMPSVSDTVTKVLQRPHHQGRVLLRVDPQRPAGKQLYQW